MKTIELQQYPDNLAWCEQKCLLSQCANSKILPVKSWAQDCELQSVLQQILTHHNCSSKLAAGALHHWLQNPSVNKDAAIEKQKIILQLLKTENESHNRLRQNLIANEQYLATQYVLDADITNAPEWTEQIWFSVKILKEWNDHTWIHQPWTLLQLYLQPLSQLVLPILFLLAPLIFMWATGFPLNWEQIQKSWKYIISETIGFNILCNSTMNFVQKAKLLGIRWFTVCFYIYGIYSQFQLSIRLQTLASWIHKQMHMLQEFWTAAQVYRESFEANCPWFVFKGPSWSDWVRQQFHISEKEIPDHYWWPTQWIQPARYWAAWYKWQKQEKQTHEWLHWLSQALAYEQLSTWVSQKYLGPVTWGDTSYEWADAYHPMFWNKTCEIKKSSWKWENKAQFLLISGPNASGKTTFLKMATYLHWFAQAWGVTTAQHANLPWIHTFWSWIRIPDQTGRISLFEAEVSRARELLSEIKSRTKHGERVWIWMDEVLSSTNWEESAATCYATLKQLVRKKSLVWGGCTSHISSLEKLEKTTKQKIQCVHFEMETISGKLHPTYNIQKGVNYQNLALSWIRQNDMLEGNKRWNADAEWMINNIQQRRCVMLK